jgi:hypothetical protein
MLITRPSRQRKTGSFNMIIHRAIKALFQLVLPNSTSQTPTVSGELALDTDGDGTNNTQGILKYYDGTRVMNVVAVDALPSVDGHVVQYDAALDKFKVAVNPAGSVATDAIFDAKGDIVVGTANNTSAVLSVGRKFELLVPDSTATTGMRYVPRWNNVMGAYKGIRAISASAAQSDGFVWAESGTPTYVTQTSSTPNLRKLTTSSSINTDTYVYINSANDNCYLGGKSWHMRATIQLPSIADVRAVVGFCASAGYGHYAATLPANSAVFRFDTSIPDTNWQCITKDSTTATTTNSTVAADTGFHILDIIFDATTNDYRFFIDNTLRATHTTNRPVAATQGYAVAGLRTLVAATKDFHYTNVGFMQDFL